jgi:hypothetical protein
LIEAQIANALGISHFLLRNKTTGKFEPISDPDKIDAVINAGEEYYRIYTKDPNVHAFAVEVHRPGEPKSYIRPPGSSMIGVRFPRTPAENSLQ